jgi:hypothetical protein
MDFLLGILLFLMGGAIGMSFMIFAPFKIRTKITDTLNPDAKVKPEEKLVSTTSSSYFSSGPSSYFDSGSGSTFLRGSSSYFDSSSGSTFLRGSSSNR